MTILFAPFRHRVMGFAFLILLASAGLPASAAPPKGKGRWLRKVPVGCARGVHAAIITSCARRGNGGGLDLNPSVHASIDGKGVVSLTYDPIFSYVLTQKSR